MEPQRPVPWWEEYLGINVKQSITKKTWKAYLTYTAAIPFLAFTSTSPTVTQARPHEVDPHLPSQSQNTEATQEGDFVLEAASASADSFQIETNSGYGRYYRIVKKRR